MADLASIGIDVDASKIKTAKQELEQLGNAFGSAEKSAEVFSRAFVNAFKQSQQQVSFMRQSMKAFQDVVNAAAGYTTAYKSAAESAKYLFAQQDKVDAANLKTARSFGQLVTEVNTYQTANKSAAASAAVFVEQLRKQEAQASRTAAANQEIVNSLLGVSGKSASSSGAGFGALEAEMTRLETKFNTVKTASMLYAKEVADLNAAQANGITITGGYDAALEKLNLEYQQFQNNQAGLGNRFANEVQTQTKGLNRMGMAYQQLGYQAGDFLVQVQSGTNWMVAFGQQATQAVAVLPMFAGSLGMSATALLGIATGLGVVIPLVTALGAAWMRTHEENSKAGKGLSDLEQRIKSLDSTIQNWLVKKSAEGQGVTIEIKTALESEADTQARITEIQNRITSMKDIISKSLIYAIPGSAFFTEDDYATLKALEDELAAAQERLANTKRMQQEEVTKSAMEELRVRSQELALAETAAKYGQESAQYKTMELAQNVANYQTTLQDKGIKGEILNRLAQMYEAQQRVTQEAEDAKDAVGHYKSAIQLANSAISAGITLWDNTATAIGNAKKQVDAYISAKANAMANAVGETVGSGAAPVQIPQAYGLGYLGGVPPSLLGLPNAVNTSPRPQAAPTNIDFGVGSGRGGGVGGGPSEDTIEKRLQALYEYLGEVEKYQLEAENLAYSQREDTLKAALEQKLITIKEYNELEKSIKEQHEAELEQISYAHQAQQLRDSADFFGSLASVAESGGNKMVKAASIFSAAQALINSYTAYTEMLKDPAFIGRPWARFAAAASVLASGLRMVSAIKGVGGGGGSSASHATSTISSTTTQAAPQTVYLSGLDPNAFYSGEQLQNLFNAFYDENDKRGKVFVVART